MYFSDLSVGLKIFAVALWLALFLAGMALIAWALSSFVFALPYEALLLLGGAIVGVIVGIGIGERSALKRHAPLAWAIVSSEWAEWRKIVFVRYGLLGLFLLTIFVGVLLFYSPPPQDSPASTTTLLRTP